MVKFNLLYQRVMLAYRAGVFALSFYDSGGAPVLVMITTASRIPFNIFKFPYHDLVMCHKRVPE